jgi:hypothetical protein
MSNALQASLVLVLFFFVVLPALLTSLVALAVLAANGERVRKTPMRVGARERGPTR